MTNPYQPMFAWAANQPPVDANYTSGIPVVQQWGWQFAFLAPETIESLRLRLEGDLKVPVQVVGNADVVYGSDEHRRTGAFSIKGVAHDFDVIFRIASEERGADVFDGVGSPGSFYFLRTPSPSLLVGYTPQPMPVAPAPVIPKPTGVGLFNSAPSAAADAANSFQPTVLDLLHQILAEVKK